VHDLEQSATWLAFTGPTAALARWRRFGLARRSVEGDAGLPASDADLADRLTPPTRWVWTAVCLDLVSASWTLASTSTVLPLFACV